MTAKTKNAATLTIREAPRMTLRGRKRIAAWLQRQAAMLIKDGKNYAPDRFTAYYRYTPGDHA